MHLPPLPRHCCVQTQNSRLCQWHSSGIGWTNAEWIWPGKASIYTSWDVLQCDAPARAMVKCVKQFSGYYGCDRCTRVDTGMVGWTVSWSWQSDLEERPIFQGVLATRTQSRGDFTFCPPNWHDQIVPHRFYAPVLLLWTRGRSEHCMSLGDVAGVSNRLVTLKKFIPDWFARKPSVLQEIEHWKATEFGQFALYTRTIALKGAQQYQHFLCFSTALCILVSPELTKAQGLYTSQLCNTLWRKDGSYMQRHV